MQGFAHIIFMSKIRTAQALSYPNHFINLLQWWSSEVSAAVKMLNKNSIHRRGYSQKENWKNKVGVSYSLLHLSSKYRASHKASIKKKKRNWFPKDLRDLRTTNYVKVFQKFVRSKSIMGCEVHRLGAQLLREWLLHNRVRYAVEEHTQRVLIVTLLPEILSLLLELEGLLDWVRLLVSV